MDGITDPSDWQTTQAPFMAPVESALTCQICREMMTAPVLTSCCHTFCSFCIRQSLNTESRCPMCRTEVQTSALRKNNLAEELIELYKPARPMLMGLLKKKGDEGGCEENADEALPRKKKRKANSEDDDGDDDIEITNVEIKTPEKKASKKEDDGMGECPICEKRMKISEIETTHIAQCLGEQKSSTPPKSAFFQKRESKLDMTKKVPFVAYSTYKDQEFKALLKKLGLSTNGTRQQWQERYTEWVTLWNANADAKNPVSKSVLLDRLRDWERTMERNKSLQQRRQKTDKDQEDQSGADWTKTHQSDFNDLIARAKGLA